MVEASRSTPPRPRLRGALPALFAALLAAPQATPPQDGIGGAKKLEFSAAPDARPIAFRRSAPDDPYLEKLRTQFELEDVVAGDETDYERVRTVCEWVRHRWEHNGDNEPKQSDPISILEEAATGKRFRCVEYAIVVAGALTSLGIPARVVGLKTEDVETRPRGAGHVVAEAWLAGKSRWIMIDGQFDVIPTLDGAPINAVELQRALAEGKKGLAVDSLSGTKADDWFRWVAPYLHYFDTALDGRVGVARAPGSLMLVPIGAKNPTVFQGKSPIANTTYTSSVATFYASPDDAAAPAPAPTRSSNTSIEPGTPTFDPAVAPELDVHRARGGLLLVRPRVNGKEAGAFIFDTGAGICMVSTPHVERLGLVPAGDLPAVGSGGATAAKLFRAETFELGPMTLPDHPVMVSDLSFLSGPLGEEIAGIIGYGVLSRCVAEIEAAAPRIALHDPKDPATEKLGRDAWEGIEIDGRVPVVTAFFEEHEGRFLLDTGANGAVSLYEPAVREWRLLEGRKLRDAKLGGVGGVVDAKEGELESFEFGGVRREKVNATFLTQGRGATASSTRAGQIGIDLLGDSVLVIDYAGARMAVLPRTPSGR